MDKLTLIPLECGRLTTDRSTIVSGGDGSATLPVPCWLVIHPSGQKLVFDTGMHVSVQDGMDRYPGMGMFTADYSPGEEVSSQIEGVQIDPADIDIIVFSHLHYDHCGGTNLIPNARIIVQETEWQAGHKDKLVEAGVYTPDDFDLGHDVVQIKCEHDIFGDGSVWCLPTPGHTAGHQSLRVNLESGPVVLTADCVYDRQIFDSMSLPPFGYNKELQLASMKYLKYLEDTGCSLYFGHDAVQWDGTGLHKSFIS